MVNAELVKYKHELSKMEISVSNNHPCGIIFASPADIYFIDAEEDKKGNTFYILRRNTDQMLRSSRDFEEIKEYISQHIVGD